MTISEKIRLLARRRGLTLSALASATEQTVQNLNNKMRRDNFTVKQIIEIGEVLGCDVEITFTDRESGEKL